MQRRQWWTGLLALVMTAALIAGCSTGNAGGSNAGGSSGEAGGAQTEGAPGNVTLRFSWWGGEERHQATLAAIEAYKQVAPHVTIEAEYQGFDGYEQKVKTQLASSTSADIMQLDVPWMAELTRSDFFLDLAGQPELSLEGFDQRFLDNFAVYNDKLVALPSGVNAYALIINKTAAEQLGVPTDVQWDWDTIYEEGKKLHERDNTKHLLLTDHGILMRDFTSMLKQRTGVQWVNENYTLGFTKEEAASALAWLDKAMKAGVYQPLGEADLFYGKNEQNPKWIHQDLPMIPNWSSTLPTLKSVLPEDVEIITSLPAIAKDAKDTAVLVRPSQLFAISSKTRHPGEAAQFLNWLLNDAEAAGILGDVRSVPASAAAQQAAVAAGKIDPAVSEAVEAGLKNAGMVDNSVATNSEVQAILQDIIEQVAFAKLTPEQAAEQLASSLENKLTEIKGRQ